MQKHVIEIISYTDPYCTWCWGAEPTLRKLKEEYGEKLKISFVMGGLVKDIREFSDPGNAIGGKHWYQQVASHWLEASSRHHMPVDEQIFYDIKESVFSTYPACIAFEAAKLQGEALGNRYLRRLREAASFERQVIQNRSVQNKLAEEVGLNMALFKATIDNGLAENAFKEDRQHCQRKGVKGFPTVIVRGFGEDILLRGNVPYKTFNACIQGLSKGQLEAKQIKADFSQIFSFISRYESIAPIEIATVFDLAIEEAKKILSEMAAQHLIVEKKRGNGVMYYLAANEEMCDIRTGTCS